MGNYMYLYKKNNVTEYARYRDEAYSRTYL